MSDRVDPLTIAAAQAVSIRGDVERNLEHHGQLARLAASRKAGVIVFPELSLTGYELDLAEELAFSASDPRLERLEDVADSSGSIVVVGAPVRLGSALHIGAFIVAPGREPRLYTKRHVTPDESKVFAPGDLDPAIQVGTESATLAICADTTHPTHADAAAERGARLYLAGVFFDPEGIAENMERLGGYASRHSMVVAMANAGAPTSEFDSAGQSSIWSESGKCVARFPGLGAGIALARRAEQGWSGEALPL